MMRRAIGALFRGIGVTALGSDDQAMGLHLLFIKIEVVWFLYAFVRTVVGIVGLFLKRKSALDNISFWAGAILVLSCIPVHQNLIEFDLRVTASSGMLLRAPKPHFYYALLSLIDG
jgi:hypothetical protein